MEGGWVLRLLRICITMAFICMHSIMWFHWILTVDDIASTGLRIEIINIMSQTDLLALDNVSEISKRNCSGYQSRLRLNTLSDVMRWDGSRELTTFAYSNSEKLWCNSANRKFSNRESLSRKNWILIYINKLTLREYGIYFIILFVKKQLYLKVVLTPSAK